MKVLVAILSFLVLQSVHATGAAPPELSTAVQQLRQAAGRWNVTTTRYAENGAVAGVASGTWSFDWVVPDRVLSGKAVIPAWNQSAGMLFCLNERLITLEMAQVGADGQLVVMSGAERPPEEPWLLGAIRLRGASILPALPEERPRERP